MADSEAIDSDEQASGVKAESHPDSSITFWSASPDGVSSQTAAVFEGVLDDFELSRLKRFRSSDAKRQYLVAHALLRVALSDCHPVRPHEWRFSRSESGKPHLSYPDPIAPVYFSLSHTKSLVVCTVSQRGRIGVDVEWIDPDAEVDDLARRLFSKEEFGWWRNEDPSVRLRRFYEQWTLKESFLKAVGRGLIEEPSCVSFVRTESGWPKLLQIPPGLGSLNNWSFQMLTPTKEHVSSIAINSSISAPCLPVDCRELICDEIARRI